MKVRELIESINKEPQFKEEVDINEFASNVFDIQYLGWIEQDKLISYYLGNWHCTDRTVGYKVYFYNDKPVAVSSKLGRKQDEEVEWVSKEAYKEVKEYIMTFMEDESDNIILADLEQEFGDDYHINFYCQMYQHHKVTALYKNEQVKIIDKKDSYNDGVYHPETVNIQFFDGKTQWVETKELRFKFNII